MRSITAPSGCAAAGVRESVRSIISRDEVVCGGTRFAFVTESVHDPTDWQFSDPEHILVVHRSGSLATMEVEFERGPCGPALPEVGHLWLIPAERRYAALAQGDSVTFCEVRIPTKVFGDRDLSATVQHRDPFVLHMINRMAGLVGRDDVTARLLLDSLAATFRAHLTASITGFGPVDTEDRHVGAWGGRARARMQRYIEDNARSSFSVADMAEYMGVGSGEFSRMFTLTFGTTPHQYVLDERIRLAKSLLVTTSKSITEISREVGFTAASHFASTFRQRTGVTATEYRRNG